MEKSLVRQGTLLAMCLSHLTSPLQMWDFRALVLKNLFVFFCHEQSLAQAALLSS